MVTTWSSFGLASYLLTISVNTGVVIKLSHLVVKLGVILDWKPFSLYRDHTDPIRCKRGLIGTSEDIHEGVVTKVPIIIGNMLC